MSDDIKMPPPEFAHMAESPRAARVKVIRRAPCSRMDLRDLDRSAPDELTQEPRRAEHFQIPTMMKPEVAMPHLRQQKRQTAVLSSKLPPPAARVPVVHRRESIGTVPGQVVDGIVDR